jgi:hypothetical protein
MGWGDGLGDGADQVNAPMSAIGWQINAHQSIASPLRTTLEGSQP